MAASSPGAFMAPRQPHPTLLFTTCTCSAAAGRSTVDRLTFRAVTRTLSFDQTWQPHAKATNDRDVSFRWGGTCHGNQFSIGRRGFEGKWTAQPVSPRSVLKLRRSIRVPPCSSAERDRRSGPRPWGRRASRPGSAGMRRGACAARPGPCRCR